MIDRLRRAFGARPHTGAAGPTENDSPPPAESGGDLDHVVDAMSDAVVVIDGLGKVTMANPAAERVLGTKRSRLVGSPLAKSVGSAGLERVAGQARAAGEEVHDEVDLLWPVRRRLLVKAAPLSGHSGDAPGAVMVITDVTATRRVEQMRRDFVANVSHELKTPVAALVLLAESLKDALGSGDIATARRFADRLVSEADRLRELSSDLLALSRVESAAPPEPEPVDLPAIITGVTDRARPVAEAKGLSLVVSVEEGPPLPPASGNEEDFERVIMNLVDNAVRYTDAGKVTVTLSGQADRVVLTIKDTGVGIPTRDLERVFERFYRVDKSRARRTGGTGLGLSIVRHIADSHGLDVALTSMEDAGTTVTVGFPVAAPTGAD